MSSATRVPCERHLPNMAGVQLMGGDVQLMGSMLTRAVLQGQTLRAREVWKAAGGLTPPTIDPSTRHLPNMAGQAAAAHRQGPADHHPLRRHPDHPPHAAGPRAGLLLHTEVLPGLLPLAGHSLISSLAH